MLGLQYKPGLQYNLGLLEFCDSARAEFCAESALARRIGHFAQNCRFCQNLRRICTQFSSFFISTSDFTFWRSLIDRLCSFPWFPTQLVSQSNPLYAVIE